MLQKIGKILILLIVTVTIGYFVAPTFAELVQNAFQGNKLTSGLMGSWSFDGKYLDTSLGSAEVRDTSGKAHHGDWQNHATTTGIGRIGQAIELDGTDDRVSVADTDDLDFTGTDDFTISLWVRPTASSTFTSASGYSATSTYYFNAYNIGTAWDTSPAQMTDGILTNYASHAANAALKSQRLTASEATATTTGAVPNNVKIRVYGYVAANDDIQINPYFSGTTAGATTNIWDAGTGGAWSPYYNITNDANAPGTWTWTDVIDLDVDVVDERVSGNDTAYASQAEVQVGYDVPSSFEYTTPDATSTILSKADGTSGGYKLYIEDDGDICFAIDDDGTWGPEDSACTSGTDYYTTDQWHHVVLQKDGGTGIYLYVDDMETAAGSDITLTATGDLSNASALYFGEDGEGTYDNYTGSLDEVNIYDKLLDVDDRRRLDLFGSTFNINASQKGKLTDGLIGYWTLDGSDTNAQAGIPFIKNVLEQFSFGTTSPEAATSSNAIITGLTSSKFGRGMITGDWNDDGIIDIAIGAQQDATFDGRVYVFYGDGTGTFPTSVSSADVTITGEITSALGLALASGDYNADNIDDLVVGAYAYNGNQGRVYIFYGGSLGANLTAGSDEDVTISGESTSEFTISLTTGDYNADNKDDLAIGARDYNSNQGRTYIFYGGSLGANLTAGTDDDVTMSGESSSEFGTAVETGDYNGDNVDDLAVGAYAYNTNQGRTYIFHGGSLGSSLTAGTDDDVTISGESSSRFGASVSSGDYNSDNVDDLAVGAYAYNTNQGRTYIFQGGSLGSSLTAGIDEDVTMTGETSSQYGIYAITDDFDTDGIDDLVVGANNYNSNQGRAYFYYPSVGYSATSSSLSPILGRIGQGLTFNGTNDYASVGDMTDASAVKTLTFWIKADDTTIRGIIDMTTSARIELDGSSQITATGWTSPIYYVDTISGSRTIDTDWRHIVITSSTGVSPDDFEIGRANGSFFNGILDEVRLYDKVLSQDEINALYKQGGTLVLNAPMDERQSRGLLAAWSFNGPRIRGTDVHDSSEPIPPLEFGISGAATSSSGAGAATLRHAATDGIYWYGVGSDDTPDFRLEKRRLLDGAQCATASVCGVEFGTGGVVTGASASRGARAVVTDGTYLWIAGYEDSGTVWRIEKRRASDGALCTSGNCGTEFGTGGVQMGLATTYNARAATKDDTYLYVAGLDTSNNFDIEKRRLLDGAACTAANCGTEFGSNGLVNGLAVSQSVYGITTDGTYLYVVGHDVNNDARVEKRRNSDGALCTTANCGTEFGTGGIATSSANSIVWYDIAIDDTYMYLIGTRSSGNEMYIEKRSLSTGALDTGFGTSGYINGVSDSRGIDSSIAIDDVYLYASFYMTGAGWRTEKRRLSDGDLCTTANGCDPRWGSGGYRTSDSSSNIPYHILVEGSFLYVGGYNDDGDWLWEKRYNTARDGTLVDGLTGGEDGVSSGSVPAIGRLGQALFFNGTTDYVSVGSVSGTLKSVSFWIKADDTTTRDVIDINGTQKINLDGSSQITGTSWTTPTYYVDGTSGNRPIDTDWHHVVITTGTGISPTNVEFGRVASSYFDGKLDEIRFYDYELSKDEITKLYLQGS